MKGMEENNLQILVNLSGGSGDRLRQGRRGAPVEQLQRPDGAVCQRPISATSVRAGVHAASKQLEDDIKAGASARKSSRTSAMFDRKADGSRLKVDDPELDAVWETCARMNVPGADSYRRAGGLLRSDGLPQRALARAVAATRIAGIRTASAFEELMTERNNMVRKHPRTRYILAHFGWHANDLARAGKLLDENPNVYCRRRPPSFTISAASPAPRTSSS